MFSSVAQLCLILCDPMNCSRPGLPVHHQLQEFTQTHLLWVGDATNHLILCCPLLLLPSVFPSIRVFSNKSVIRIRWPKYWSFSFSISPSSEHPRLISFRMDWLCLLAVQGTPKSLIQYYSSKASILQCSAFCIGNFIQPSHPLSSTSPSALNLSQHQDLFKWVSSSHQVAKVLEFQCMNSVKSHLNSNLIFD